MSYPVGFEMDYVERRSRLTTFFRWILAIPHFVFAFFYGIVFEIVLIISWFALLFTARWPASLQGALDFCIAYTTRADALLFLITETYPPFGTEVR